MSTPLIFIILPAFFTPLLFVLQRYARLNKILGASALLGLLLLSWRLPIATPIFPGVPGIPAMVVDDSLSILGRRFIIADSQRQVLMLIYLLLNLWFIASFAVPLTPLFTPLLFGIGALLVAAMSVDPPLYSILFIVLAALACIPLFSPPGNPISDAALRLLIFQVLGMGLFLFADWFLSTIQDNLVLLDQLPLAFALLGLGFAFLAGIFPFHTWIPMIAGSSTPLAAAFSIYILPLAASIAGLRYLFAFSSFEPVLNFQPALRLVGLLMVVAGGAWAVFERHLVRIMAFAMLVQVGSWLLAFSSFDLSMSAGPLHTLFYNMLLPQAFALVLWSLSLDLFRQVRSAGTASVLWIENASGLVRRYPFVASGLVVANFSLAGLPLLANFPFLFIISTELARSSPLLSGFYLLGHAGLAIAGLRTLYAISRETKEDSWIVGETRRQVLWLVAFILAVLMLGILPQWRW